MTDQVAQRIAEQMAQQSQENAVLVQALKAARLRERCGMLASDHLRYDAGDFVPSLPEFEKAKEYICRKYSADEAAQRRTVDMRVTDHLIAPDIYIGGLWPEGESIPIAQGDLLEVDAFSREGDSFEITLRVVGEA